MGKRFGKLPAVCSVELGPAIQPDASGNPQPNTRILGCIADIRNFEASHPEATVLYIALFRQGWEMGASWVENHTPCIAAQDKTA